MALTREIGPPRTRDPAQGRAGTGAPVLVVGAGQSGLKLALGLSAEDYGVTLAALAGPEEVLAGNVMSTQCLFGLTLHPERAFAHIDAVRLRPGREPCRGHGVVWAP